jgi:hypothetical protein
LVLALVAVERLVVSVLYAQVSLQAEAEAGLLV